MTLAAPFFPGRFRLRAPAMGGPGVDVVAGDFEALRHRVQVAIGDRDPDSLDHGWFEEMKVTEGDRVLLEIEWLGVARVPPSRRSSP